MKNHYRMKVLVSILGAQKAKVGPFFLSFLCSLGDLGRPMASKGDQSRPKGVQKATKVGPKGAKGDQS